MAVSTRDVTITDTRAILVAPRGGISTVIALGDFEFYYVGGPDVTTSNGVAIGLDQYVFRPERVDDVLYAIMPAGKSVPVRILTVGGV